MSSRKITQFHLIFSITNSNLDHTYCTMKFLLWTFFSLAIICKVSSICCGSGGCLRCEDCTEATPYCGTEGCNIFGCNCGGSCRTGTLCPIGAVGRRGQTVVAGPNCNIPYDRLQPFCAIVMPGQTSWEWVNACTTRGKRSVLGSSVQNGSEFSSFSNASDIFSLSDTNNDNQLSFREARKYLVNLGFNSRNVGREIRKLDANHDNYLSQEEIDN